LAVTHSIVSKILPHPDIGVGIEIPGCLTRTLWSKNSSRYRYALKLQSPQPMDTIDQGRYEILIRLNKFHYCARAEYNHTNQETQQPIPPSVPAQTLKVAEVYLYVGNGCFETANRFKNDRGGHRVAFWLYAVDAWRNRSGQ